MVIEVILTELEPYTEQEIKEIYIEGAGDA